MGGLKWNRGKGGGQKVDHIGLSANVAATIEDQTGRLQSRRRVIAGMKLRQQAAAGDKKAQAKLIFGSQKGKQGLLKALKINRAIMGEPNQTKVPKGCVRMAKRDPDTGNINTLDLPLIHDTLRKVLHLMAAKLPWRHLVPSLSDQEAAFLETGRWEVRP